MVAVNFFLLRQRDLARSTIYGTRQSKQPEIKVNLVWLPSREKENSSTQIVSEQK